MVDARIRLHARVAKLADALDLGSSTLTGMGVRLPPLAFLSILRRRLVRNWRSLLVDADLNLAVFCDPAAVAAFRIACCDE